MSRTYIFILGLVVLGLATILGGVYFGAVSINYQDIFIPESLSHTIVTQLRVPRLINAFIVGACLAFAGASFQGVLQNPLADPYILGVSSGAALGACIAILFGFETMNSFYIPIAAIVGAVLTILFVYFIVRCSGAASITHYILSGIIVNSFFAAVMLLLFYVSDKQLSSMMHWLMGDLGSTNNDWVFFSGLVIIPMVIWVVRLSYQLTIISTGDSHAQALGINVKKLRRQIFILASCMTGIAVANAGMIGFVGLVIPHMVRAVSSQDFRVLLPLSFFAGGIFLMGVDTVSRTVLTTIELPIGVVTSFIGAPFFLYLLIRASKQ
ncbi:iron ABC transporter [Candidatus Marinamargulisbacteria bacterium SCGC AAA071-K20]|nr:iron ABC transporter [Candidatus Marinamargulisbacteria bacterium SCGC AAA071-K20]